MVRENRLKEVLLLLGKRKGSLRAICANHKIMVLNDPPFFLVTFFKTVKSSESLPRFERSDQ